MSEEKWRTLCRRTNDPKLSWIENELDVRNIPHRRNGESSHAPILEVPDDFYNLAYDVLDDVDEFEDDDPVFQINGKILLFHNTGFIPNPEMILRHVRIANPAGEGHYELMTYDTGKQDRDGRTNIGFKFWGLDGRMLFAGASFRSSPMHAIDSDEAVRSLLHFLTLRPGDTDKEYFGKYTARQMDFARGEAEHLQILIDENPPIWEDVNAE